jgi:hypothetical protein
MPAPPVVIGVEFEAMSVSNGPIDGVPQGSLTIYITVIDGTPAAPGNFTARAVQEGPAGGVLTVNRPVQGPLDIQIQPGTRALINLTDGVTINLPWSQVRDRVSLSGTAGNQRFAR